MGDVRPAPADPSLDVDEDAGLAVLKPDHRQRRLGRHDLGVAVRLGVMLVLASIVDLGRIVVLQLRRGRPEAREAVEISRLELHQQMWRRALHDQQVAIGAGN